MNRIRMAALTVATLIASPALAHGVHLFVATEGDLLTGRAYYSEDAPLEHATVQVKDTDGNLIAEVETDHDGRFTFRPSRAIAHEFVVATDDGHRAVAVVQPSELPVTLRPGALRRADDIDAPGTMSPLLDEMRKSLEGQIRALKEDLNRHEESVRIRDVIGGVGYIVGVMGLIALIRSRRRGGEGR